MRPTSTVLLVASVVAIGCCCAACTGSSTAEPTGETAAPRGVPPSREPVPMSLATPADDAAPSTWVVSAGGIGPVVIGDALAGTTVHLTAFHRDDSGCGVQTMATWVRAGSPSVQVAADDAGRIVGVAVTSDDDTDRSVARASPRTQNGQGVGSSIEAVQAAFPALVEFDGGVSEHGARLDAWGVPVGDRWVTFRFDETGTVVQTVWVGTDPLPPDAGC